MTADDIVESFVRATAEGNIYIPMLAPIASVEKKDDATVTVKTTVPNFSLLKERLAIVRVVPASSTKEDMTAKPVGSGPWMYESISDSAVDMVPNPEYNGDHPAKDKKLHYDILVDPTARVTAQQEGSTLVMEMVTADAVEQLESAGCKIDVVDGFGTRFAADCGGQMRPLYPCLTALQCAKPNKSLAGIRAKAAARLLDGDRVLAEEMGEVQFTDYGLSGICIMQLSGLLAPGRSPKHPAVELDLFPAVPETELAALFAARTPLLAEDTAAAFWLGLLHGKLGRALWAAAALPDTAPHALPAGSWQKLAHTAKHWRFEGLAPCGWRQAQTTGGGLALTEVEPTFQFKGCPGLYFVGETLDCAGSCGGFNLHWAFGSGLAAGRDAAKHLCNRKR